MRVYVRVLLLAACALSLEASPALANDGLFLPSSPTGVGGEDSIETAEGTRCRQSINSNGPYLDTGVVGTTARAPNMPNGYYFQNQIGDSATAYVRVTVPLGKRPQRLDCSKLYELEIQRLRREVELLKMSAE